MKSDIEKLPKGEIKIKIELTVEEMKPYLEKAAFLISEKVKISGFRPGKAPYDIVKTQVGEEKIWQEAIEPAVHKTLVEVLDKEKLPTIGSPKIDILKLAPNNPFIYQATVFILPDIELGDYKKNKIKRNKVEVKKEQMDKALEDLQKMKHSEIIVDRPAQKGDKVEIDFKTFLEKVLIDQGDQKKFPVVIGDKTFIPGFEDHLIGAKAGEEKKFSLKMPENYHDKKLANRTLDFEVKINGVYEISLPEINDDLAKGLGNFENLEDLKKQIQDNLKQIPEVLINSESQKMISELEHNIQRQGLKFEDYLTHIKKKREDLLLDFTPNAIKRVKSALVIREIAKQEKIEITDKEIEQEVKQVLAAYENDSKAKEQITSKEYKDYLRNVLTSKKVIDSLKKEMVGE